MSDPLASNVALLIPFDNSIGAGSYADRSPYCHPVTAIGNAHPSRVQRRVGAWSGRFDGSGDAFEIPHHPAFSLGTQDYCVEAWVYPQAGGTSFQYLLAKYNINANTRCWSLRIRDARVFDALCSTNGSAADIYLDSGVTAVNDQWTHLALSREGQTFRLFVDGVLRASATSAAALFGETNPVTLGRDATGSWWFSGFMDGVRITTGAARYSADFEPPMAASDWSDPLATRVRAGLLRPGLFADFNRRDLQPVTRTSTQARYSPAPGIARRVLTRNVAVPHREGRLGCQLVGTVAIKGVPEHQPVSRPVRLYAQGSGLLVAETRSDAQGHYRFDGLDPSERYFAVAFDTERWYRAVVADQLVPEYMQETTP